MTELIIRELGQRHSYISDVTIETIYFGGGTPSILSANSIGKIISEVKNYFQLDDQVEITLEVNPDDITLAYLESLRDFGVNRLSIGIQSFNDNELKFMNRSHDASQACESIIDAKKVFDNISVDLIFGGQYTSEAQWSSNLSKVVELDIPHLSCYSLTIEDNTVFGNWLSKKKLQAIHDDTQSKQFITAMDTLEGNGYLHYEISNYAKPKNLAKHNTNYWKEKHYLGLGPSAHSFNGISRQWNPYSNAKYIHSIQEEEPAYQLEVLSMNDRYNEYILTSLRTMWGLEIERIKSFGPQYLKHFSDTLPIPIANQRVYSDKNRIFLTKEGKLFADIVAQDFFYI